MKIIAMTGSTPPAIDAAFDADLIKPFDEDELFGAIDRVLNDALPI